MPRWPSVGEHVTSVSGNLALQRSVSESPIRTTARITPPKSIPVHDPPRDVLARYRAYVITADLTAAWLASVLATVVRFGDRTTPLYVTLNLVVPWVWVGLVALQRGYEQRFFGTGVEEYRRVAGAAVLFFTLLAVASFTSQSNFSRFYVLVTVPLTALVAVVLRRRLRRWLFRQRADGHGLQRLLVVGRVDATGSLIEKMHREPQHGLLPVGVCLPMLSRLGTDEVRGVPVYGEPEDVLDVVDRLGVHTVAVVSHPDLSGEALRRLSWALEEREVELIVSPGIIEVAGPRLSIRPIAGLSLLHLERPSTQGGRMLLKAGVDRVAGTAALVLLAPLLVTIAALIKVSSPGPVLFRQVRIGVDGVPFTILKFRSMVVDAEARLKELRHLDEGNGVLFKLKRDPRVTRVGAFLRRYSLDELPQLLNIAKGEMSIVGPRPPLPGEVAQYSSDANRRLRVRPGLTGLWQVSGRSDLSWEESLLLDLRYVDNWSLALDAMIVWRTVKVVLGRGEGAY